MQWPRSQYSSLTLRIDQNDAQQPTIQLKSRAPTNFTKPWLAACNTLEEARHFLSRQPHLGASADCTMYSSLRLLAFVALAAPATAFFRKIGGNTPAHQKSWPKNRTAAGGTHGYDGSLSTVDSPCALLVDIAASVRGSADTAAR
jgi:hypothetical protein